MVDRSAESKCTIKEAGEEEGLKLVYEDDGVDIPQDEKEKIFQEEYGTDTGYGLYLIKKMCEVYGWNIQENEKPVEGAKFIITIPQNIPRGSEATG